MDVPALKKEVVTKDRVVLPSNLYLRDATSTLVVFCHGLGMSDLSQMHDLSDKYVGVVNQGCQLANTSLFTYTARGHGSSRGWEDIEDNSQFAWNRLSQDMISVGAYASRIFKYAKGPATVPRLIIGGHSMGSATALYSAIEMGAQQQQQQAISNHSGALPNNTPALGGIILVRPPTAWETRRARKQLLLDFANKIRDRSEEAGAAGTESSPPYHRVLEGAANADLPPIPDCVQQLYSGGSNDSGSSSSSSSAPLGADATLAKAAEEWFRSEEYINSYGLITCPVLILCYKDDASHPESTSCLLCKLIPQAEVYFMENEAEAKQRWPGIVAQFVAKVGGNTLLADAEGARSVATESVTTVFTAPVSSAVAFKPQKAETLPAAPQAVVPQVEPERAPAAAQVLKVPSKPKRVNVYCLPVKPRSKTDDEVFNIPNRSINHGINCPCCE